MYPGLCSTSLRYSTGIILDYKSQVLLRYTYVWTTVGVTSAVAKTMPCCSARRLGARKMAYAAPRKRPLVSDACARARLRARAAALPHCRTGPTLLAELQQ